MPYNALAPMYNAYASTLSFEASGGKSLATGVADFRCHFLPISNAVARSPFGGRSSFQAICDGHLPIRAGDIFLLKTWFGSGVAPYRQFKVDGMARYPHRILNHMTLALSEYSQK
jgi:hypothetical protein